MSIRFLLFFLVLCSGVSLAKESTPPLTTHQPLTNSSVTGYYYFAQDHLIRDVSISTPINGKFYFRFFIAQTPTHGKMTVQYYNEVEGVASFDEKGVAHFISPYKNCELDFLFLSTNLLVDQRGSCGMAADIGMEARGIYNQLEQF